MRVALQPHFGLPRAHMSDPLVTVSVGWDAFLLLRAPDAFAMRPQLFTANGDAGQRALYETLHKCLADGGSAVDALVDRLKAVVTDDALSARRGALEQALAGSVWLLDLETSTRADEGVRAKFVALVKGLVAATVIARVALEKVLDPKLLEDTGVVRSGQQFFKQLVLQNTRANLTQPTFFLLSECSEGYSKLICELAFGSHASVQAVVGHFSLDLARCADVALDLWPRFRNDGVMSLLALVPPHVLIQVVSMRLKREYAAGVQVCV